MLNSIFHKNKLFFFVSVDVNFDMTIVLVNLKFGFRPTFDKLLKINVTN